MRPFFSGPRLSISLGGRAASEGTKGRGFGGQWLVSGNTERRVFGRFEALSSWAVGQAVRFRQVAIRISHSVFKSLTLA